jgi:hypothetical protein
MAMRCRRDTSRRADVLRRVVCLLRDRQDATSTSELSAALAIPADAAARILRRLAARTLARTVAPGLWVGSPALRLNIQLTGLERAR